jgi:predicted nucleic-acid-binding protein
VIALDTNIMLRYLADVDSAEGPAAKHLVEEVLSQEKPGFISVLVLAEMLWVLSKGYNVSPEQQRVIIGMLLAMDQLVIDHADSVEQALSLPHRDLADCILHEIGQTAGCTYTATFDKRFAKLDQVKLVI